MLPGALGLRAQQVGHCVLGKMSAAAAPIVTSIQRRLHSYDEAIVALNSMQGSYCEGVSAVVSMNLQLQVNKVTF